MSFQGRLYKSARAVLRVICPRCTTPPLEAFPNPAVYVCHHQNMRGPIATMLWLPIAVHLWSLSVFLDKQECRRQFRDYTFHQRHGWPKWLAAVVAWLISGPVTALVRSTGAIPVYRKSLGGMKTIRQTSQALQANESVIIFPDIDYQSNEDAIGEIYDGFLLTERYYHQRTGEHVSFVPLFVSAKEKTIILGEPIHFEDGDFLEQRPVVRHKIRAAINQMVADH